MNTSIIEILRENLIGRKVNVHVYKSPEVKGLKTETFLRLARVEERNNPYNLTKVIPLRIEEIIPHKHMPEFMTLTFYHNNFPVKIDAKMLSVIDIIEEGNIKDSPL